MFAKWANSKVMNALDTYFADYDKANNTKVEDDVWPGDKGYYHLAGHWWASPVAVETRALYYRKDLFKAAGLDPDPEVQHARRLALEPVA